MSLLTERYPGKYQSAVCTAAMAHEIPKMRNAQSRPKKIGEGTDYYSHLWQVEGGEGCDLDQPFAAGLGCKWRKMVRKN